MQLLDTVALVLSSGDELSSRCLLFSVCCVCCAYLCTFLLFRCNSSKSKSPWGSSSVLGCLPSGCYDFGCCCYVRWFNVQCSLVQCFLGLGAHLCAAVSINLIQVVYVCKSVGLSAKVCLVLILRFDLAQNLAALWSCWLQKPTFSVLCISSTICTV